MPRPGNGNPIHLDLIPEARRQILRLLKRSGPLPIEDIAEHLDVTVSGARQHLTLLGRDGVVTYQRIRQGPGRPRHLYELTERGDALFPRRYREILNELLGYVRESDPALVDRVFGRRAQRRAEAARQRLPDGTLEERVRGVVRLLEEEANYPALEALEDGAFRVVVRNCPMGGELAERYASACAGELSLLRRLLPDADVRRTAHILKGQPFCAYEIRPAGTEPAVLPGVHD